MSVASSLNVFLAVSLARSVVADPGDEFSNNLFSDLAPLLALFGERATMQFMSQSMGWADNIILAMAPLGIITAIVGAIRVGGPSWLKAIIGRARENLAVAEAELMSSTSKEVCELWNGQDVVRSMGVAPISEFICLLSRGKSNDSTMVVRELHDAVKEGYLETESDLDGIGRESLLQRSADSEAEKGAISPGSTSTSEPDIVIVRNTHVDAPNVSLNTHDRFGRGELRTVAAMGSILQLGVLIYSGFATYYPTLMLRKNELPVAGYAFPCTAVGTMLLVTGMLLCSHVVESSTEEKRYRAGQGRRARMIWLQKTQTVSDQSFLSFAIWANDGRAIITTSQRADKQVQATVLGFNLLKGKAVLGTIVGLCGFTVQFIGLRGMHWSASIAQLSATLVMTMLRSWVRRGLAKRPVCNPLSPGFELDWFALTLGDVDNAPWMHTLTAEREHSIKDWSIVTGGSPETHNGLLERSGRELSQAHRIMNMRRDLGRLADWRSPASAEALSVARAIEITMDTLFGSHLGDCTWSLAACEKQQPVNFRLERRYGKWKAYSDEIEAALSLWLFSVGQHDRDEETSREPLPASTWDPRTDAWLRATGSPATRSLRLLGSYTQGLHRDLWWWMPSETIRIIKVREADSGTLVVENHRVVGCGSGSGRASQNHHKRARYTSLELSQLRFGPDDEPVGDGEPTGTLLATEVHIPLKLLYAQDMFSAFIWAAAKTLEKPIEGTANVRPADTSSEDSWQSFSLQNARLSRLAQGIQGTGLGSLEEIYLSIIPALSVQQKLPHADAIVDLARQQAKRHEQIKNWRQAGDIYLWLFQRTQTFPEHSGIATRATSVLMEYLRTVTLSIGLRERQQYEGGDIHGLKELKSKLEERIRTVGRGILSSLMRIYEEQGRGWECVPVQEARCGWVEDTGYPEAFNFTELHRLSRSGPWWELKQMLERAENVNPKDIHDWTPLHYATAIGSADAVRQLLKRRVNANAQDHVGRTPLHVAAVSRHEAVARLLAMEAGADKEAKDTDGRTPLHVAAASESEAVTRLLAMEAGADKEARDGLGRTPLHVAAASGSEAVARLLAVVAKADKEAKDRLGRRPLHWAAASGSQAVTNLLAIEARADINARDGLGRTPLHLAAASGRSDTVRLLIDEGADEGAKDGLNRTPLHWAAESSHADVVRLLE